MTAQLWKDGGSNEATVTFTCPWCEVIGTARVSGAHQGAGHAWLLLACPAPSCRRGALLRVPVAGGSWAELATDPSTGVLLDAASLAPASQRGFESRAAPPEVVALVDEAIRAHRSGLERGALLLLRRAVAVALGSRRLASLAGKQLTANLVEATAGSALVGERLEAGVDLERLIELVRELVHQLFELPARLEG